MCEDNRDRYLRKINDILWNFLQINWQYSQWFHEAFRTVCLGGIGIRIRLMRIRNQYLKMFGPGSGLY
jgi:hypothetical protein